MSESEHAFEQFWAAMPKKAEHPSRVPMLEAFRWIGEPLSPVLLVDLFDGQDLTMWEAAYHLRALARLGVVRPYPAGRDPLARRDVFDLPYRLTALDSGKGRPERPGHG